MFNKQPDTVGQQWLQQMRDGQKAAGDMLSSGRETDQQLAAVATGLDAADAYQKRAEARAKGAALINSIGGLPEGHETPNEYYHGGAATHATSGAKHLSFRNFGQQIASGMKNYSTQFRNIKGLTPAGTTIVNVPLANATPITSSALLETQPRLITSLPVAPRSGPVYSFLKHVTVEDAGGAGVVAPGEVKPSRKLGIQRVDSRLRVIAVLSDGVDRFLLEDNGNLQNWVSAQLADSVVNELEQQVLTGDGTGENFTGLANTSGIQTQAYQTDPLITLQYGLSKLESLGITPAFIALPSSAWLAIQTTRNTSGAFDVGGPVDATARTAWGTPVVMVPGLPAGTGYVVGQDSAVISTDESPIRVEWGTPGDSFSRNELVVRVEGRFNLDVYRPHGIVKLTLAGA